MMLTIFTILAVLITAVSLFVSILHYKAVAKQNSAEFTFCSQCGTTTTKGEPCFNCGAVVN